MKTSVAGAFRGFNEPLEGVVHHMYLDILGLVTVGVGNLIDPISEALKLPFRFRNNPAQMATQAEIAAEWNALKANTALAKKGHRAAAKVAQLELSDASVGDLIQKRLLDNEKKIKKQATFAKWDSWPADAQLAVLSMAWAMGPNGFSKFPRFSAACAAGDFRGAAANCRMAEAGNPGVVPRNDANQLMFRNAATVTAKGLDPAVLHFPKEAKAPVTPSMAFAAVASSATGTKKAAAKKKRKPAARKAAGAAG